MTRTSDSLTHKERAQRRKDIAAFVKQNGGDRAAAALKFEVTLDTVKNACIESGVRKTAQPSAPSTYAIIARLMNTDTPIMHIADEMGVSAQRVKEVYNSCREFKIPVRTRKRGRPPVP